MQLPEFLRYFIRDSIEGILAFVGTVNVLAFLGLTGADPNATVQALAVGIIGALIAAARRNKAGFLTFVNQVLGTTPDTTPGS